MASTEKLKQSLYFPDELLREIKAEAIRLDRSLSWTVQRAWRLAREEVRKLPSAAEQRAGADRDPPAPLVRELADSGPRGEEADVRPPSAQLREFLRGKFDHDLTS